MIEYLVVEKTGDGSQEGLGRHHFAVPPQKGDFIGFDDLNGVGQMYEVIAVMLATDPSDAAGDLIVRYVSTDHELRMKI